MGRNMESYARFAGNVIDFKNKTAHDVLELFKISKGIASVLEVIQERMQSLLLT
jgi:hypothetical protein